MSYNPLSNHQDPFSDQNILSIEEPASIHATEPLTSSPPGEQSTFTNDDS